VGFSECRVWDDVSVHDFSIEATGRFNRISGLMTRIGRFCRRENLSQGIGTNLRIVMSSIMRRRSGLITSSVMGMLLFWVRSQPFIFKTGRPCALQA
jgi:hypothetical protein